MQPNGTRYGRDAQLLAKLKAHAHPQEEQHKYQQQQDAQYPQCDQQGPPSLFLRFLRRKIALLVQTHLSVRLHTRKLGQILQRVQMERPQERLRRPVQPGAARHL